MSVKKILIQYVRRGHVAKIPKEELHQHLAGVASRDNLKITEKELDDVVFEITGEKNPASGKKPTKARKSTKNKKTGDNVTDQDLKEIEKS